MGRSVSTKPPSGMRDFLPQDLARRRHVVGVVERVYESFGFVPLETPAIENLSTLLGKYGEEGDKLLYRILHRRDRLERALQAPSPTQEDLADEGLRYDLTVPLARVFAAHRGRLPRCFRRYQIQPVWRADRPGKGRYREFYQCDVDVVGTRSPLADADVCAAVVAVMIELGFADLTVLLNHRALLRALLRAAGVPAALEDTALVGLDKLDKLGGAGVLDELARRGVAAESAARLLALVADEAGDEACGVGPATARLERLAGDLDADGRQAAAALRELLDLLGATPAAAHVRFAPSLARGLGYYTGAILELTVPDLAGSLGGGGRYDGLIGMFSGEAIPAVGCSLGLERILLLVEERGMFPPLQAGPEMLVCGFPDVPAPRLLEVAARLRATGRRVEVFPEPDKKLGQQLKYATEVGAREAVLVGAAELARGVVIVKDLATGAQREEEVT